MSAHFQHPNLQSILRAFFANRCDMEQQLSMMPLPFRPSNFLELCDKKSKKTEIFENDPMKQHFHLMANQQTATSAKTLPRKVAEIKPYLCIVEILPSIVVSDGYSTIEAIFTKESINEFRRSHGAMSFSKLRDRIILVNQWSLQVDAVDSMRYFHSCHNMTVRLVIEQF